MGSGHILESTIYNDSFLCSSNPDQEDEVLNRVVVDCGNGEFLGMELIVTKTKIKERE